MGKQSETQKAKNERAYLAAQDANSLWARLDHPAVWLAYLPLFFIPWFFDIPEPIQVAGAIVGLVFFLALYFASLRATETKLIAIAVTTLSLSFALAFTASNWTVIAIYASAMVGELRPSRRAAILVSVFAIATCATGFLLGQTPWFWVLGVFLMIMVGVGAISRVALEDKNTQLLASRDEVRRLAASAERERIGRDLHDLLGRTLTLIAIKADLAAKVLDKDSEKARGEMQDVAAAAREGLADVRAAVSGMTGASLGREISASQTALKAAGIAVEIDGDVARLDAGTSAVLAMALREAVTNVIRHSGAKSCKIALNEQSELLEMEVSDDGDGKSIKIGGGISGLRSRLSAAGGDLELSGTKRGTRLIARLPLGSPA